MEQDQNTLNGKEKTPGDGAKKPRGRRFLRLALYSFIAGIALLCAALAAGYIFAKEIIERYALPFAAEKAGIERFSAKVDRADAGALDMSSISIGNAITLKHLEFRLSGGAAKSLSLKGFDLRALAGPSGIALPGIFKPSPNTSNSTLPIPWFVDSNFSFTVENSKISVAPEPGSDALSLEFPFDLTAKLKDGSARFALSSKKTTLHTSSAALSAETISISGTASPRKNNLGIRVSAETAELNAKIGPLKISGIKFKIPLSLALGANNELATATPTTESPEGSFALKSLSVRGRELASAKLTVTQKKEDGTILIQGDILGPTPNFKFPLHAEIASTNLLGGAFSATANLKFNTSGTEMDLGKADPALKGFRFNGSATLRANVSRKNGKTKTTIAATISAKKISNTSKALNVENASLDIQAGNAEIAGFNGFPKGKLAFGNLTFGNVKIESGEIDFQIEPENVVFVERAKFAACGGHVESDAFRVSSEYAKAFDITLHCSKMNVADVLNVLKIGHADGKGAVSGRIPLKIENRRVHIDDGFLDSAPGEGGNIRLTDFMGPMAFVTEYAQLDIIREALKNFDYDWMRIAIKSIPVTDTLLVKLTMSGAPATDLPFEFDEKKGGFHLTKDPGKTAHFQKITFEITFILPGKLVKLPK
jgi:hypothetical protein